MSGAVVADTGARALEGVRAVIVNNFPGPGMGGGEVQNLSVVRALIGAGADVRVIAPGGEFCTQARDAGAAVSETDLRMVKLLPALRAIRAAVADGPTVVMGTGYFTGILVRLAAGGAVRSRSRLRVVNLVAVTPGASLLDGGSRVGSWARELVDRVTRSRVDRFVAVTDAVGRALESAGVKPSHVDVIPNGVDVRQLEESSGAPLPAGVPDGPLVVCAARLEPVKGVEYLIRAATGIPDAHIVIAGEGSERGRLEHLAGTLGVADRTVFLGSVVPLAGLLRRADVVVLPSLSEGLPLVALEAMALARPVVATAVGGVPDLIVDGENGLLVPPADAEALAGVIGSLLRDPMRAQRVAAGGYATVHASYTIETLGDAYVRLFAELVSTMGDGHVRS